MPEQMPDIAPWLQLGFAVAVAWYLLTKAMPRYEERAEKRDASFLVALEKERDGRKQDADKIVAAVDDLSAEVRNINGQGGSGFGHGSNGAHRGDRGSRG